MTWAERDIPNPGSDLAVERGCTCPVWDNHHGAGRVHHFDTLFIITMDCPLHDLPDEKETSDD